MRAIWFLLFALFCLSVSYAGSKKHDAFVEDNDFAEFEEFEDEEGNLFFFNINFFQGIY